MHYLRSMENKMKAGSTFHCDEVEPLEPPNHDDDQNKTKLEITEGINNDKKLPTWSRNRLYIVSIIFFFLGGALIATQTGLIPAGLTRKQHEDTTISLEETETARAGDMEHGSLVQNHHATPKYSILPKRIYTVIGLEDSGTKFVTQIIKDALNLHHHREGSRPCTNKKFFCREHTDVQVTHFSLPWGSYCLGVKEVPVVDVVLPSQCTRVKTNQTEIKECDKATNELWGFKTKGDKLKYPPRFMLDISTHKQWYDDHGVEQFIIIVVRDEDISAYARKKHCNDETLKAKEEEVGTKIIIDAINKYVLKKGEEKLTRESYNVWHAKKFQKRGGRRRLSALPFGDNVVVVSYETLLKLKSTYIEMLYDVLGIDSNYVPTFRNGNAKYLPHERVNGAKKPTNRLRNKDGKKYIHKKGGHKKKIP